MGLHKFVVVVGRRLLAGVRRLGEHRVLTAVAIAGLLGAAGLAITTTFATAQSCSDSWTGGAGTPQWDDGGNWSNGVAPLSTDSVCITLPSASPYDVDVGNETIDVASLTVGGPGSDPTLIMGSSSAEGTLSADVSGAVDIASTGTLELEAPGAFAAALTTGSITNAGTFSVADDATLTLSGGSTFDNAGGTISNASGTFAISSPSGQTATLSLESGGVVDNSGTMTVDDTVDVNGGSICGNQLGFGANDDTQTLAFAPTPGTGPACGGGMATDHIQMLNAAATLSGTIPASYTLGAGASGVAYEIALSGDVVNDGTIVLGFAGYAGTLSAASGADYLTNNGTLTSTSGGAFNASLINNGTLNLDGPSSSSPETSSLQNGWFWENTGAGTITVGSADALQISSPSGQTATLTLESGGVVDNSGTITVDDSVNVNGGSICGNQLGFGASGDAQTLAFAPTPGTGPACGGGMATDHIQMLNVAATVSGTIPALYTLGAGASGVDYEIALSGDVVNDGTIVLGFSGYQGTVSAASSADRLTNNGTLTSTSGGTFDASLINNGALNIDGSTETSSLQNGWSWQNEGAGTITVGSGDALEISSPSGQSADFIQDGVIDNSGTLTVADPITVNGGTICNKALNLGSGDTGTSSGETLTLSFAASPTAGPACSAGQATDQVFIYNVNATIETNIPAGYTVPIGDGGINFPAVSTPGDLTNAGTLEPEWGTTLTIGSGGTGTLTNTGTLEVPATGYASTIDAGAVDNTSGNVQIADSSPLAISGTYAQGSQGTFTPQIDGTSAGSTYGQLTATGGSTLAGTLNIDTVSGFSPTTGNTFEIIKGGAVSGTFGTILGEYPPPNTSAYGVAYDADDVTLNVSGQSTTQLTVSESGDGSGTVSSAPAGIECGSTCVAGFPQNQQVTLTETPASGSVFNGWSGACAGSSTTCEVTLSSAQSVGASFIVPPNTTTSLQSSPEPSTVDQQVTYTATVSPAPDGGKVAFTDGGSTISGCGSVDVNTSTGVATCAPTYSAVGSHTIQASYSGDTDFGGSLSSDQIQVVDAASPTTTLQSSANPSSLGQQVTYTASVSPAPDGGTVAFTDGGSTISGCGSVSVNTSTGEATCQATYASTGAHTIEASYSGDTNYGGSDSGPFDQVVSNSGTSTSLESSKNPSLPGQQVTYTATVSPTPDGGTVAFTDGVATISGCGLVAVNTTTGVATCQVTYASSGSHSIEAAYSGDTLFGASHGTLTQVVSNTSTSTSVRSSANPSTFGQAVTFTATITPAMGSIGNPTGTVTFADGTTTLGTGPVSTTAGVSTATYTTSTLTLGLHSITAVYGGDANFEASPVSSPLSQDIRTTPTVTTAGSTSSAAYGQSVTFTATLSPPAGQTVAPTGSVTFTDGSTALGTPTLSIVGGRDVATLTSTTLGAGSHTITARYNGDNDYIPASAPSGASLTISRAATTVIVGVSTNPSITGQRVTLTATITPNVGNGPTGTVTFFDVGKTLATAQVSGPIATYTTSSLSVGTHSITAVYAGDANFQASPTSRTQAVTVTSGAPAITKQPTNLSVTAGQSATFSAAASGTPTPTVQWQVSANTGKTWTNASGGTSATLTLATTAVPGNGDEYRAVFTNGAGSATTTAATLTVKAAPGATVQPAQTTIPVPGVQCPASGACTAQATSQATLPPAPPTIAAACGQTLTADAAAASPSAVSFIAGTSAVTFIVEVLNSNTGQVSAPPVTVARQGGSTEVIVIPNVPVGPALLQVTDFDVNNTLVPTTCPVTAASAHTVDHRPNAKTLRITHAIRLFVSRVLASVDTTRPTAADISAFKRAFALARSPKYTAMQSLARITLVAADELGFAKIEHALGYRTARKLSRAAIVLGSARGRGGKGAKVTLRVKPSVLGGRIVRFLSVIGPTPIHVKVSVTSNGKVRRSTRTLWLL